MARRTTVGHVGRPVKFLGDGVTVNVAARVADYARPSEVLVSEAARACCSEGLAFTAIGPTALKGVAEPVSLFVASRAVA